MMTNKKNKSSDVTELQTFLYRISLFSENIPCIHPDGIYGPLTARAVTEFQREYGLPETGEVNKKTFETIVLVYRHLTDTPPESIDIFPYDENNIYTRNEMIYFLQIMLHTIQEKYSGLPDIPVSGSYDKDTAEAVRCIQKLSGFPETGEPDKYTWNNIVRIFHQITK